MGFRDFLVAGSLSTRLVNIVLAIALPGSQTGLERRGRNLEPQVQVSKLGLFLGELKNAHQGKFHG